MKAIPRSLITACLAAGAWFSPCPLLAQTTPSSPPKDYSKEPFVIEQVLNKVQFENDGTYKVESDLRIRVQSASGVQDVGVIQLPYASSIGNAEVAGVKVTKPGGAVVMTPPEAIQDMPAQITVSAPAYSDLKVKQLAVKGLEVGDVLEYKETFDARMPLIPGQFWYSQNFSKGIVVLDEQLEIRTPRDRYVKFKSPKMQPVTTEASGYRVYTWKTAQLEPTGGADDKTKRSVTSDTQGNDAPFADVQLTSFHSWDEIAQWYRQLEQPRILPSPEIRAKADEITRGLPSDDVKIHALYDYVATKFRYVGVSFGIGRYQPHAAAEVLSNGYGDCKDKHTLLEALLAAAGIKAYPALINSSRKFDTDVPSPSQFDHMITAIPRGKDFLWLDTTPEVAPFGMLTAPLRDSQALVIPDSGAAQTVKTPADPPFPQSLAFQIQGKMSSDGTLDAKVQTTMRGDVEVALRNAFHHTSPAQWNDLVQRLSQAWSFAGTVSDAAVDSPESTENAFSLKYAYNRKDYPNWPDVLRPPLPPENFAPLPDDAPKTSEPIKLESPGAYLFDAKVELPQNITPRAIPTVDVKKDFAEYHAAYTFTSNAVHVERRLTILMREIPRSRSAEYKAFWKIVNDDSDLLMALSSSSSAAGTPPAGKPAGGSPEAEVERLLGIGDTLSYQNDSDGAIAEYRRALQLQPDNATAHYDIGNELYSKEDYAGAASEHREALRLRPNYPEAHRSLGDALWEEKDLEGAIAEYREALRLNPNDSYAHTNIGRALLSKSDFDGAIAEFRQALRLDPNDFDTHLNLGGALSTKDLDGALAEYREAARLQPNNSLALVSLGRVLVMKRDLDGGIAQYHNALRLNPKDASAHYFLGVALLSKQDFDASIAEYREALRLEPDDAQGHSELADALLRHGRGDDAVEEAKKAVAVDARYVRGFEVLGNANAYVHRDDEAIAAWRQMEKLAPENPAASVDIARFFIQRKRFDEALAELTPAVEKNVKNTTLLFLLGEAEIRSGDVDKGMEALQKVVRIDSTANMLNNVSYELAEDKVRLDDALNYARQAVEQEEDTTAEIHLAALTPANLMNISSLAAYWDTLGWAQFRLGHMGEAEKYLIAAWKLGQFPAIGDHLGQFYEKAGKKDQEVHYDALTMAAGNPPAETGARLTALLGGKPQADKAVDAARSELSEMRAAILPQLTKGQARAEFFVLLERRPDGVVGDVKFISGSEELRDKGAAAIKSAKYDVTFPDDGPTKLVRRGILDCSASGPKCHFVLLPVESVNSVN